MTHQRRVRSLALGQKTRLTTRTHSGHDHSNSLRITVSADLTAAVLVKRVLSTDVGGRAEVSLINRQTDHKLIER